MARRFCPKCGAAREFSVQKFCTSCGASLPDPVPPAAPGGQAAGTAAGSGMPVWVVVIAGILVLGAAAVLLLPHLAQVTSTPLTGPTGAGDSLSLQ